MINLGFWSKLNKPIFVLAPMADVTDCVFRSIIAKYGKPDVFWTEFVSADGLAHPEAREKLLIDLKYSKEEHPIVAQIFGSNPENIRTSAILCRDLGFDGVDINMGCPDKSIERQGAGAGMIKNPEIARQVIIAAKESGLPVSVKTRIGYNKNEIETWIRGLLEQDIAVLTVHLRSRKEMSKVPAHWDLMKRVVEIRDELKKDTLILGNGDALDLEDAKAKASESGCDGVMLGRAIFGNPWLFKGAPQKAPVKMHKNFLLKIFSLRRRRSSEVISPRLSVTLTDRLRVMVEHTKLFEKELGVHKNFAIMKKHYKAYVNGFDGAKELRVKLMEAESAEEIENITNEFIGTLK